MIIGVLKEIKSEENRVALTPSGVDVLVTQGHKLLLRRPQASGPASQTKNTRRLEQN